MSDPSPDPTMDPPGESCSTCFFSAQHYFSLPASGMRGAQREDVLLMTCCRHAPALTSGLMDLTVIEARWPQVRPEYWCGEWSSNGSLVVR